MKILVTDLHRFLSRQLLYPLLLSSVVALALWAGRAYFSHTLAYGFIPWNLFLAWIPYGTSFALAAAGARWPGRWWLLPVPLVFWLIFFPNAPYTITDLLHLDERAGAPLWYDIGLIATYAWSGCFLAVVSLNTMHRLIEQYVGKGLSWLFVAFVLMLSGLGIYLGRFLYWNSWDILLHPRFVLGDLAVRILHPIQYSRVYGVTIMFAAFLLVCYVTFISVENREKS